MDRRIIDLFDEYTHRPLDRRVFLERLAKLAGGAAAASALLPLLENDYARAQQVPADAPDIHAQRLQLPGASGPVDSYFVLPGTASGTGEPPLGRPPAVILIHENRGLNPHMQDVARRLARAGFVALAPDLLSPVGGTPEDEDLARQRAGQIDREIVTADLRAAVAWLAAHPRASGKVGAVGFCWGGGMVNRLAVAEPELDAAVVFYGESPRVEDVSRIRAPLLLHYAGLDDRINAGVPDYEAALRAAGKTYTLHMYEGANHAFHNDTNAARYDETAARLAWDRTIGFLRENLAV